MADMDAKVRVRIDTRQAVSDAERLERRTDDERERGIRRRKGREDRAQRDGQKGGALSRVAGTAAFLRAPGKLGSKVASLAGIALAVTAALEVIEDVLPIFGKGFKEALPPGLEETIGEAVDAGLSKLSDEVTELKSFLASVLGAYGDVQQIAKAQLMLGLPVKPGQLLDIGLAYQDVREAQDFGNRQTKKLAKQIVPEQIIKLLMGSAER